MNLFLYEKKTNKQCITGCNRHVKESLSLKSTLKYTYKYYHQTVPECPMSGELWDNMEGTVGQVVVHMDTFNFSCFDARAVPPIGDGCGSSIIISSNSMRSLSSLSGTVNSCSFVLACQKNYFKQVIHYFTNFSNKILL